MPWCTHCRSAFEAFVLIAGASSLSNALKAREFKPLKENELTAFVFERLEKGKSLVKMVIKLRVDPTKVKEIYEQ